MWRAEFQKVKCKNGPLHICMLHTFITHICMSNASTKQIKQTKLDLVFCSFRKYDKALKRREALERTMLLWYAANNHRRKAWLETASRYLTCNRKYSGTTGERNWSKTSRHPFLSPSSDIWYSENVAQRAKCNIATKIQIHLWSWIAEIRFQDILISWGVPVHCFSALNDFVLFGFFSFVLWKKKVQLIYQF